MFGATALGQPAAAKPAFNFSLGGTTAGAAPAAGGLFGTTQPGGLFGTTATAAAKPFNFATTAAGGLAPAGSLFAGGATTNAFAGGIFGGGATTTSMAGSVFGPTGPALTTTVPANATISTASPFGGNDADVAQIMMLVNAYPYGDSPLFKNLPSKASDPSAREQLLKPTSASAQKALLSAPNSGQKVNARSGSKLKPTPLLTMGNTKNQIFEGFEDDEMTWLKSISYTPRSSVKKLVLPKRGSTGRLPGRDSLEVSIGANGTGDGPPASALNLTDPSASPTDVCDFTLDETHAEAAASGIDADKENGRSLSFPMTPICDPTRRRPPLFSSGQVPAPPVEQAKSGNDAIASTNGANITNDGVSLNGTTILEESSALDPEPLPSATVPSHPAGIQLSRSEYYTIPSLEELGRITDSEGSCVVENLTIGREGYGSVFFPGETDLTGLNLDEIIFFRRQEVQVYVDEDNKPEVGSGINKPAEVTLDAVFPNDKTTREKITDPARLSLMGFSARLEKSTMKMGAKFMEYRPETGSWVFAVKHFSKYGFDDSDEEDLPMAGIVEGGVGAPATTVLPPAKAPGTSTTIAASKTIASQSTETHLGGGDAPSVVGLGGVDISALAERGEALINTSIGLGGIGRSTCEPTDGTSGYSQEEGSTPAEKLATLVGTDSSRVQLMKASFLPNRRSPFRKSPLMKKDKRRSVAATQPFCQSRLASVKGKEKLGLNLSASIQSPSAQENGLFFAEKTNADAELITSLQQQLSTQREKNKEISAEKDELQSMVDEAANAFIEKESETSKLQENIEKLTSDNSILSREKEKLELTIADLKKGHQQAEGDSNSRAESNRTEIARLTEDLRSAESRAAEAETASAESTKELDEAKRLLEQAEYAAVESAEKLNVAENRLEETARKMESLQRDLTSVETEKSSTNHQLGDELRKLRNRVAEKEEESERVKAELAEKTSEMVEESKKNESLTKELEAERSKLDRSSVDRRDLMAEKEAALAKVESLKKKITAIEIENENMKVEKSEAIEEKEKLNSELDRLLKEDDERTNALKNELEIRLKELNAAEEDQDEISNSSPPAKPPRSNAEDSDEEDFKENESARKRPGRSTRQSSRKPSASASKAPLQESKENENESEPSDESEDSTKTAKNRSRRKLYTQPDEPVEVRLNSVEELANEQESYGFSPLMRKLDREAPTKTRAARSTRNK